MSVDNDEIEEKLTESYLLGISVGWEQASGWLMLRASQEFVDWGPYADRLRSLAREASKWALEAREKWERHKEKR